MTFSTRTRVAAGSIAAAFGLALAVPTATAMAAPPKPATMQKVDGKVDALQTIDFQAFLKGVSTVKEGEKQGSVAKGLLAAYNDLSTEQKLVANAANVTQLAAKQYGKNSPEAQAAQAAFISVQMLDGILRTATTLSATDSPTSPEGKEKIAAATFSPDREDDPIWGADADTPSPNSPSFKVTQNKDRKAK